ncbi:MAG TPA: ABC transporter ATP-binding protein [Polyangiaceae bacterium]|nr:ABC transporter ATP-binding protein [Polyangiaceae bacterium]
MSIPFVSLERVCRRYGAFEALSEVTFRIDSPGIVGLLGPNGAGKTTLLDVLAGLAAPDSGGFSLFGERIGPGAKYPRRRVGVVLQREFVPDHVTVHEYAELFAAIHGVRNGAQQIIGQARLEARKKLAVERLSGGEAQRLFVAASLVHAPDLLLLDEPSARLDPVSKRELSELLRRVSEKTCVLMATHDLIEAERACDHCLFILGGRLCAQGSTAELMASAGATTLEDAFFHFCSARVAPTGDAA